MSERMYAHMKNTLNDIDVVLKNNKKNDTEKVWDIRKIIDLLQSVECGETVIDKK